MHRNDEGPLVSTEWLAQNLDDPDLRIVDVRWHSRFENGKGLSFDDYEGYLDGHIPGAAFIGMAKDLSDANHPVADMLVPPEPFAELMGRLGIGNDTLVVSYDNMGLPLGSARFWWALSYYGHDRVRVLDGGLRQWQTEGRPLTSKVPNVQSTNFEVRPRTGWIADKQRVIEAIDDPDALIVDCLSPEQYSGEQGGHQWGTRTGHIPGAVNVPALANIAPELAEVTAEERAELLKERKCFTFSPQEVLTELYGRAGVSPNQELITYCGRGFAASCGLLALKVIGHENVRLYDGSWSEWSADLELPTEVGKRKGN
ncbi:MAG: sulfurtransferase [Hyphomicrobiaceae bacterium]